MKYQMSQFNIWCVFYIVVWIKYVKHSALNFSGLALLFRVLMATRAKSFTTRDHLEHVEKTCGQQTSALCCRVVWQVSYKHFESCSIPWKQFSVSVINPSWNDQTDGTVKAFLSHVTSCQSRWYVGICLGQAEAAESTWFAVLLISLIDVWTSILLCLWAPTPLVGPKR